MHIHIGTARLQHYNPEPTLIHARRQKANDLAGDRNGGKFLRQVLISCTRIWTFADNNNAILGHCYLQLSKQIVILANLEKKIPRASSLLNESHRENYVSIITR
jgi:hypothetical protein